MRKKLIGMMMACVLLIGSGMPVSATEVRVDGQSVDVQVEHDNKSSFCINIPESIYLDDSTGYYFTASLMNITSSERVCIYANDKTISMHNEAGDPGTLYLYGADNGAVANFETGQMQSNTPMYSSFDAVSAGHYTGTATFVIRLESKN